jgi:thiol-disulfide isomerase/thioredoxin
MKTKLEVVANVVVIAVALAVGYVVLRGHVGGSPPRPSVAAGDRLGPVPGIDWSRHRRTLVLALRTDCHYCRDSAPFYQRLAQVLRPGGDDVAVVAVFPNDAEAVSQTVKEEGLSLPSVSAVPLEGLGVVGTPTLILVDREGKVVRSWVGLLTPRGELDLLKAVGSSPQVGQAALWPASSARELSALQMGGDKGCKSGTTYQK